MSCGESLVRGSVQVSALLRSQNDSDEWGLVVACSLSFSLFLSLSIYLSPLSLSLSLYLYLSLCLSLCLCLSLSLFLFLSPLSIYISTYRIGSWVLPFLYISTSILFKFYFLLFREGLGCNRKVKGLYK